MKSRSRGPLLVVIGWVLATSAALGQVSKAAPVNVSQTSPEYVQWFFFLSAVNHMDQAADRLQAQGKDGAWLRNAQQTNLGFNDQQFQPIRASAQRLMVKFNAASGQMHQLSLAYRENQSLGTVTSADSQAYRSQLVAFTQQRGTLLEGEIASLRSALGPDLSAKLDTYLKNHIGLNAAVSHPSPHSSALHSQDVIK